MSKIQKQPPKVFNKKTVIKKFRNIHRKTLVLESLFNKVVGLEAWQAVTLLKKETPTQVLSCQYCKIFQNINQKIANLNMKDQYSQRNTLNEEQLVQESATEVFTPFLTKSLTT